MYLLYQLVQDATQRAKKGKREIWSSDAARHYRWRCRKARPLVFSILVHDTTDRAVVCIVWEERDKGGGI